MRDRVATSLLLAVATAAMAGAPRTVCAQSRPNFQGGWLFDDSFRAALRAPDEAGRRAADTASNVLLYSLLAAPYVSTTAYTLRLHAPVLEAAQIGLVDSVAFGLSFGSVFVLKTLVARERPHATAAGLSMTCMANPTAPGCDPDRNASFPSGHAAIAFAAAGLICTHEIYLGPRSPWNAATCGTAMAAATATSLLRIVADRHYATDTLAGAAIGLTFGMLVPITMHYASWSPFRIAPSMRRGPRNRPTNRPGLVNLGVAPFGTEGGGGMGFSGTFF